MNVMKIDYKMRRQINRDPMKRKIEKSSVFNDSEKSISSKIPKTLEDSSLMSLKQPHFASISPLKQYCGSKKISSFGSSNTESGDSENKFFSRYSSILANVNEAEGNIRGKISSKSTSEIAKVLLHFSGRSYLTSDFITPKSRNRKTPKTSCSSKFKSSDYGGCILAVTEGRGQARGEVGIASMDPQRALLILCQISDGPRYINSLTKMNVFDFSEVIVPNTFVDGERPNKLYTDIRSRFPNVTLTNVQRRHFSETAGIDMVRRYCSPEYATVMTLLRDKFYALSAAAALIKYVEFTQNVTLSPKTLKIEYQGTDDIMLIDLDTANRLELITCMSHPETNRTNSLMGVINHCRTKVGERLLRANILQPFFDLDKITNRLNCVDELINDSILFCGLEAVISSFTNVENLLNLCFYLPQRDGLRTAEYQRKCTLLLKTTLDLLPRLISSLEPAKCVHFRHIIEILKDSRLDRMRKRISETIFENTKVAKGSVAAHLHGCFAIKPGVNGLLDVAKKTYCEIVQEITDYVSELCGRYDLPLRVSFTASKGFHLRCPIFNGRKLLKKKDLPEEFILIQKSKLAFTFYTAHLVALDKRSQNVLDEIKLITNAILCELLMDIRDQMRCLFDLAEVIAELDVLLSFARVSSIKGYTKPKFGCRLELRTSRHPILDATRVNETIPNDVFADDEKNFIILTGPNQSGKSIYIRQVALLQIMAQIGCFVPAAKAIFKLVNRIFSRIGFDDSIDNNACTMIVEIRDVEYIRQNLTGRSIIIIDELCRGTSIEEGTHLAFAICEHLLDFSAFVFFTTHYLFLTRLEELYPNVVNWHFDCEINVSESGKTTTRFNHILKPGTSKADSYGLKVAETTSFPKDVWSEASKIAERLRQRRKVIKLRVKISGLLARYELALKFKAELIANKDRLKLETLKNVVETFKQKYSNVFERTTDSEPAESRGGIKSKELLESPRHLLNSSIRFSSDSITSKKISSERIPPSKEEKNKKIVIPNSIAQIMRLKILKKYKKLMRRNKKKRMKKGNRKWE